MSMFSSFFPPRRLILAAALVLPAAVPAAAQAAAPQPPRTWIDPDTGHRVIRLTNEPGSISFYFNDNAYTPDGKEMVYTTPSGISVLDLTNLQTRQVVAGPVQTIVVGRKTPTIYYTRRTGVPGYAALWCTNVDTGETRKLADLPRRAGISAINADETLAGGTYVEGDAAGRGVYGGNPRAQAANHNQDHFEPINKSEMMTERLAAKLPMTLFTINLQTGRVTNLLVHRTDWLNHLQFSPADPTLLLYCHEGLWWLVNRIWTIRTDGTQNELVHQRTLQNEIAGHEWWDPDGKTVWYQLHYPTGMGINFLASYNVDTRERLWYSYGPEAGSIHHFISPDGKLFCGDGDPKNPWIVLCRPVRISDRHTLGTHLIEGGYLVTERLVNMSRQNYRLEPNPTFTPDQKFIVFRSNMFGPSYAFAVEVAKADPAQPPPTDL